MIKPASKNTSLAKVSITGGTIKNNVYGGANTSKIYGYTNLSIGPKIEEYDSNDIHIYGTVFGGGEANASGSEEYKPLLLDTIKSLECSKIDVKVVGEFNKSLQFTHLNFVFTISDYPKIDTPPFERSEDFQYFEALMTTHFEVPGTIPYVDRETVIGIAKEGFLWKVSSVSQVMTHERQIFKCDVNARLIQRSENLYLLNGLFRPKTVYNFRGLERIQGLSNYIDRQYRNMNGI